MEENTVLEKVRELTAQALSEARTELVDLTYRRESGGMVLRFTVDKGSGISVGECGNLSRKIENILDEANAIEEHYTLEVQSPGLDRRLVKTSDFERAIGEEVVVATYGPIAGSREHTGKLKWVGEDKIELEMPAGEEIIIPRTMIAKAKLYVKF
ncbi:MAG: ribosome maturation factor RimP [Candidatus Omnitrophota bacterium]|nr:ribosome maturation factor RimP [Candidatus Omnitrophota bacterium]